MSGRVSLCLQTLEQASATSCETSRQVFKEVMALFTTFTLEANKPDRPAASTGEQQVVGGRDRGGGGRRGEGRAQGGEREEEGGEIEGGPWMK